MLLILYVRRLERLNNVVLYIRKETPLIYAQSPKLNPFDFSRILTSAGLGTQGIARVFPQLDDASLRGWRTQNTSR